MRDFLNFLIVTGVTFGILAMLTIFYPNVFTLILFVAIAIPTAIALISGAPFVPTPFEACEKMLTLAKVKKDEHVVDIGCGDGRIPYLAANKFKAKAFGYELSPVVYVFAKIKQIIWRSKAKIIFGDFRKHDLSKVDCLACYMLPESLKKFIPKFEKELQKGVRVVSYSFPIGNWKETYMEPSIPAKNISKIWVYEIGKHHK